MLPLKYDWVSIELIDLVTDLVLLLMESIIFLLVVGLLLALCGLLLVPARLVQLVHVLLLLGGDGCCQLLLDDLVS